MYLYKYEHTYIWMGQNDLAAVMSYSHGGSKESSGSSAIATFKRMYEGLHNASSEQGTVPWPYFGPEEIDEHHTRSRRARVTPSYS